MPSDREKGCDMERFLKDSLVECSDDAGMYYSVICLQCGGIWKSSSRYSSKAALAVGKDAAAKEAGEYNRVCHFCGQTVCAKCHVDVGGIRLCARCAEGLKSRLEYE